MEFIKLNLPNNLFFINEENNTIECVIMQYIYFYLSNLLHLGVIDLQNVYK